MTTLQVPEGIIEGTLVFRPNKTYTVTAGRTIKDVLDEDEAPLRDAGFIPLVPLRREASADEGVVQAQPAPVEQNLAAFVPPTPDNGPHESA